MKNVKKFGQKQEKLASKRWKQDSGFKKIKETCNSGATFNDSDFWVNYNAEEYCIEFKATSTDSYRLTSSVIRKIWEQSFNVNRLPLIIVYFEKHKVEVMVEINRQKMKEDKGMLKSYNLNVECMKELLKEPSLNYLWIKDTIENCIWDLKLNPKRS